MTGTGTLLDPYIVMTAADLNSIRTYTTEKYFKQGANIDVISSYPTWTSIDSNSSGVFYGYYDGNNYKISGLTKGLFSSINGGKHLQFKNIKLIKVNIMIDVTQPTGVLVNSMNNMVGDITVADNIAILCNINNTMTVGDYCGGITGYYTIGGDGNVIIKRCSINGKIICNRYCGGIIGGTGSGSNIYNHTLNIEDSINNSDLISYSVGGMIGTYNYTNIVKITRCINTGFLSGYSGTISGIMNSTYSELTDCYALQEGILIHGGSLAYRVGNGLLTRCYALSTMQYRLITDNSSLGGEYINFPSNSNGIDISFDDSKKGITYTNYTFNTNYWNISENSTYPYLNLYPYYRSFGNGSIDRPYLISNTWQLYYTKYLWYKDYTNYSTYIYYLKPLYFKQTANINIDTTIQDIEFRGLESNDDLNFRNYYNGDNYEIRNLTKALIYTLIFPKHLQIINVKLINVNINTSTTPSRVGALINTINHPSAAIGNIIVIDNILITGNIIAQYGRAGGVVGSISGGSTFTNDNLKITRCLNTANITSSGSVGGIVGLIEEITGSSYRSTITFEDCENRGFIRGWYSNSKVGGIIGYLGSKNTSVSTPMKYVFNRCINKGDIKGTICGGIIGKKVYSTTVVSIITMNYCYALNNSIIKDIYGGGTNLTFSRLIYREANINDHFINNCNALDTMKFKPDDNIANDTSIFPSTDYNGVSITNTNTKKSSSYTNFSIDNSNWGIWENDTSLFLQILPLVDPDPSNNVNLKMYIGNKQILKIYKGTTEITKIYKGTTQI